jgi:hypothetical protein
MERRAVNHMRPKKRSKQEILLDYIEQAGPLETPCWITPYRPGDRGYISIEHEGKRQRGHCFFYQELIGPIPDKLQLDHLCRVRHCVNPLHLEPVTQRTNILRGESIVARRAKQTHCKNNHPLSGDNLYIHPTRGTRDCRICRAERKQRHTNENRRSSPCNPGHPPRC